MTGIFIHQAQEKSKDVLLIVRNFYRQKGLNQCGAPWWFCSYSVVREAAFIEVVTRGMQFSVIVDIM
ncbi:MAG TPA: hypothetical protein DEQ42_19270 [Shigella sp.]|nr:hypothetical protein [Shigella sp.]